MDTTEQILVAILGTFLAIFLVIAIWAGILVVKLLKSLRRIVTRAEHVVESAESVGEVFKNAAGPISILNFIRGIVQTASEHKSHKEK